MDITLDLPLVGSVLSHEYRQTCEEIAALGPYAAYERSQRRHDGRIAAAPDVAMLACSAGCSWCCHFSVDLRPVEIARILDFVEHTFSVELRERVRAEIEANSRALTGLDEIERMQTNVKCPFLVAGRCSIYEARPQTCRNYHATDAAGCKRSFEEPGNGDIDPEFAPLVYQAGGAHVDAFSRAMRDAGYDVAAYEMNSALAAAMKDPAAFKQRFEAKQQPALEGPATEVPLEFWDV